MKHLQQATEYSEMYLASTESEEFRKPRRIVPVKRVRGAVRDDYLLVEVSPPVIGQAHGMGGADIDLLILATRTKDNSLFPIGHWPIDVHIAIPKLSDPRHCDVFRSDQLDHVAWGTLYLDAGTALDEARR
jgi:hypothetical protein